MRFPDTPFVRADLDAHGLTPQDLRSALEAREVTRLLRGVYAAAGLADTVQLRATAAALVLRPGVVVCDHSAAWLHGVDAFDPTSRDHPQLLDVVSTTGDRVRRPETRGGKRTLTRSEITQVHGVPVTTPLRTACDLGRLRGRMGAYAAMCMLARQHDLSARDFVCLAAGMRGSRGVVQLRELAPLVTPACESSGEAWTLLSILDAGLPRPVQQFEIVLPVVGLVRLDHAYVHARVAVEYDGEEFHSSVEDRERDKVRRTALRAAGWTVIVVRKEDLRGPALERRLGQLREVLVPSPGRAGRYARGPRW
jgi:hypothetical protein